MWDIHRTFPAHDYFKSTGGEGQEMLYKISKVSLEFKFFHSTEIYYCKKGLQRNCLSQSLTKMLTRGNVAKNY